MIFLLAEYNCYRVKPPEIFGFGAICNAPVSRSVSYWGVVRVEGNALIIVPFAKVPQPYLIEIVNTQTSRNRVYEYCVGRGG